MNDEWRKRLVRIRAMVLGPNFVVSWGGCRWNFNREEEGLLWDEPAIVALLRQFFVKDSVFLDAGANVGGYAIRAAKAGMEVMAFEPDPENVRRLMLNEGLNQHFWNLTVFRVALGSECGKAFLSSSTSQSRIVQYEEQVRKTEVRVETVDSLSLDRLDLVKVDVEGYELEVVRGAYATLRRLKPRVLVEVHDSLGSMKEYILEGLLGEIGYHITRMGNGHAPGISPKRYLWCEP